MSDGPYKCLPMSRAWKRLAKFAENENFERADMCAAARHALESTWRKEVPVIVVKGVRDVFLEREPGLFRDAQLERLEAVAHETAGYGLGRLFLDHASSVLREGLFGEAGLTEAARRVLDACSAREARHMEEYYCRKASARLTRQVCERIAQAIGAADFDTLARQCAGLEARARRTSAPKHTDIEDGVPLP